MFLDDTLLKLVEETQIKSAVDVQQLNVEICKVCEEYYKSKMALDLTSKETKVLLDRTFSLFDSFIRRAKVHSEEKVRLLAEVFENHTFKMQFMCNTEMREIYENL